MATGRTSPGSSSAAGRGHRPPAATNPGGRYGVVWRLSDESPAASTLARKEQLLGLAIISLLVLAVIAVIAIPILARVLGEATRRNPNRPEGEGDETGERDDRRSDADRE
jgi:hypothetical protein